MTRNFKKADTNNVLDKHNLETDRNFNVKDSKMSVYNKKNAGKGLNLVSFQTTILLNRDQVFFNLSLYLFGLVQKSYKIPY